MDTEQLLTFERIVREGSLSRAAWSLGVAQATVSARVQALERAVGGPLFMRNGRGVALTDLGLSFRPYAQRALEVLQAGIAAAQQAQAGQRGRVTIGVLESLSGAFLGPALAHFHATHPQVEVLVRAGRQEELAELLLDGIIDVALLAWPLAATLGMPLDVLLQMRERVVLAAAPGHPLARQAAVEAAQIAALACPFLLLRWWTALPPAVARIAAQAQPRLDVPMDTGRQMVLSGVGAGFFPWMQVAEALAAGRLREVAVRDISPLVRASALVRRAGAAPLAPAAADLIAAIHERARQLGLADAPV
jgi:DNA-binding transcriptional LysR family regulator